MKAFELTLVILLLSSAIAAQDIIFESYPGGVDFWVVIPYNNFVFKKGIESSKYYVSLEIKNQQTKQTINMDKTLEIPSMNKLQDSAVLVRFFSDVDPGKYQALLRVKNLSLGDKSDLKKTFTIGERFTEIGQPYLIVSKDGVDYLPSDLSKMITPADRCEIRQSFSIKLDSLQVSLGSKVWSYSGHSGSYNCDITEQYNASETDSLEISLFEGNIRYHMGAFLYDQWFTYNNRYEYKDQIQQLRYVANQNEWKSIRNATEDAFEEIIERFWEVHDPSPGTIRNEVRESFYQRVLIADERYTIHKKLQGWKSDRGRIYIKYGDPDEIYSEVHPIDLYPFIIWTYYRENLQFEFADTGGFGQYRLRNKDEEY